MPTIHDLRQTYSNMADEELRQIAVFETTELSDDATQVLREEMGRRGLLDGFNAAISAQRHTYTPDQVKELIRRVRQLPCPMCGIRGQTIHGRRIITRRGFLWLHRKQEVFRIGCKSCIRKAGLRANTISMAWGLFGFPFGLILGFGTVLDNLRAVDCKETAQTTKAFEDYVRQNTGVITLLLQSEHKTQSLVNELN
ncbi:MAG: hypothetical protein JWM16_1340 [Verrucomicrobiales bacterium]|nr:hypothetical protein [Verrucomicrobiales bacterium]